MKKARDSVLYLKSYFEFKCSLQQNNMHLKIAISFNVNFWLKIYHSLSYIPTKIEFKLINPE